MLRWGIIGAGGIANKFADSAAAVKDIKVVAVASRTYGRAEAFAARHGISEYYSDYSRMLSNKKIDAVYVATTHNFHFENVKAVLEAGKHVLCEKPFTVNAAEMSLLMDLASERELFMMEAMWTRFLPAMFYVRELLKDNVVGKIKQIRATFGFQFPFDREHRLYNPRLAGGALLDAGIYPLSFANMVMKEKPAEIRALAEIGSTGIDEQSTFIFRYRTGTLALLNATINAPVVSRAEIIGTGGRIIIPDKFLGADEVLLELNGSDPVVREFPFDEKKGFQFEIAAASEAIRKGEVETEIMPVSDTLQLMETIDEIKDQLDIVYENDKIRISDFEK